MPTPAGWPPGASPRCSGEILRADPEHALDSLLKVTLGFEMPGHKIAGFAEMSEVLGRGGVFGTRHYQSIVEELLAYWDVGSLTGLSPHAQHSQDRLLNLPPRLARMADYAESKAQPRPVSFDVIYKRTVEL